MGSLSRQLRRRQEKDAGHNYQKKLNRMIAKGEIVAPKGQVTHVHILHDDYCPALKGGVCNCDPDINVDAPGRRVFVE